MAEELAAQKKALEVELQAGYEAQMATVIQNAKRSAGKQPVKYSLHLGLSNVDTTMIGCARK